MRKLKPVLPLPIIFNSIWNGPRRARRNLILSTVVLVALTAITAVVWRDVTTTVIVAFSLSYFLGFVGSASLYWRMLHEGGTSLLAVALREEHKAWAIKCFMVAVAIGQLALAREGLDRWMPLMVRDTVRILATLTVIYAHLALIYVDSIHRTDLENGREEARRMGYGERTPDGMS